MIISKRAVMILVLLTAFSAASGLADEPNEDVMALSIEELMNVEVAIASKKPLTLRETPGIVTVITREDILNSGARDLLDALTLLVPGITFASDVEGVVGISMRGMWAHEGKVLLMIDGQEANEEQFATTAFGNHYPVENIERIEIIRGPGSAIYGGYAGVGVINIITKGPEQNGAWASALYSQMEKTYSHRNLGLGFGHKTDDLSASLCAIAGEGNRSDRDNVDVAGDALSMEDNSELDFLNLNFNLNYKGLDLRAIMDRYDTTQITLWGENYQNGALDEDFDSYFFNVKYDFKEVGGKNLTITPEWKYKIQYPWQVLVPDQEYTNEKRAEKMQFGVSGIWDITDRLNLVSGMEYYTNDLYMPDTPSPFEEAFNNGKRRMGHTNYSAYAQLMVRNDLANMTIGGRYDDSDEYGSSFVPRFGLTRAWDRLHAKAMYSESFRLPGGIIPNRIPVGFPGIEPEEGQTYEVELGYRFTDTMVLTVNAFDVSFDEVIVYQANPDTGIGSYFNSGKFGTRGLEAEYRYRWKKIDLLGNYAYYKVSENNVELYDVPGHDDSFLAFPQHRLNLLLGYRINERFSVHPSISFFGKRYGYAYDYSTNGFALEEFDPTTLFNMNLRIKDVVRQGIDLHLGAKDLFDAGYEYIQAYDGGAAPLPGPSRAIYVRISCEL
jgi:outer membrane receptor for ferrienterochelin and colicin